MSGSLRDLQRGQDALDAVRELNAATDEHDRSLFGTHAQQQTLPRLAAAVARVRAFGAVPTNAFIATLRVVPLPTEPPPCCELGPQHDADCPRVQIHVMCGRPVVPGIEHDCYAPASPVPGEPRPSEVAVALRRYGWHLTTCAALDFESGCTCGFDAVFDAFIEPQVQAPFLLYPEEPPAP